MSAGTFSMLYNHTYSLQEGPEGKITSLSIVHEEARQPKRWERILDRLLFWRPTPVRLVRTELFFPSIRYESQALDVDADGAMTMTIDFTAQALEAPPDMKAELL